MPKISIQLVLLVSLALTAFAVRPGDFKVTGPGGGGAMFNPTISPHDPNTVLVSCDMTGSYITHDGGRTWRMFNLRGVVNFFVFDPLDPKTMYAHATGLWRSTDGGESWNWGNPTRLESKAGKRNRITATNRFLPIRIHCAKSRPWRSILPTQRFFTSQLGRKRVPHSLFRSTM